MQNKTYTIQNQQKLINLIEQVNNVHQLTMDLYNTCSKDSVNSQQDMEKIENRLTEIKSILGTWSLDDNIHKVIKKSIISNSFFWNGNPEDIPELFMDDKTDQYLVYDEDIPELYIIIPGDGCEPVERGNWIVREIDGFRVYSPEVFESIHIIIED